MHALFGLHVTTILKNIPAEENQQWSEQQQHWLSKCIAVQGYYFKGENY